MTILYDRAVLLAKVETTFREDASPVPASDAMLVAEPNFVPDVTQLERDITRANFSPVATVAGRKVGSMTFRHEVRNNGNLDASIPPALGVLLKGCGMAETQVQTTETIGDAVAAAANAGTCAWAKTTAYDGLHRRVFTIVCDTGGISGVATVDITSPAVGEYAAFSDLARSVTDATPITLGTNGAQVTPTVGTDLVSGDTWTITVEPERYEYSPVSSTIDSLTLYLYLDGLLHIMLGARGTWSMEAQGGQYAIFTFTFTGDFATPTDVAIPTDAVFESQVPPQVELAALRVDDLETLYASRYMFDIANDIQIKESVNASEAYLGGELVGRQPIASFDPEAVLEATHSFWADLAAGTARRFQARVGTVKGGIVDFYAPNVQLQNLAYGNRTQIRTYDASYNLAQVDGNDELKVSFW